MGCLWTQAHTCANASNMRLCVIRGVTVRVHPLFPCLLVCYALAGQGAFILALVTALLLHEGGHLWMAVRLRAHVSQVELTPFGGSMQVDGINQLRPRHAFLITLAGPLTSLLFIPISILIIHKFRIIGGYFIYLLVSCCLIFCVNLIPILPLDGGRMLLSLISMRFRRESTFRALIILGRIGAVSAILYSALRAFGGSYQPLPLMLGFYLLYASALEEKQGAARYLAGLISRRVRLDKRQALPVQTLCAARDMPLFSLLPQLSPGAYHRVLVVDGDAAQPLGEINEEAILSAALNDASRPLGDLLARAGHHAKTHV